MAMDQQAFNANLLALPALIRGAPGGNNIADAAELKVAIDQAKTELATADSLGAAFARAAGGPLVPGSYFGNYINLQGTTVLKPTNFTAWANGESLLNNFDGIVQTTVPGGGGANHATTLDELSGPAPNGMFASIQALRYVLSYYPDNNNRIKLPKLITANVGSGVYTNAITTMVNAGMTPAATTVATDDYIERIQVAALRNIILPPFSPNPQGARCVSTRTGRADLGNSFGGCPTLSPLDAANLSEWGRARTETNKPTPWTTPPNFLHYTDIKLAEGAKYNDTPENFGVARTTTDNSAVLIVTCQPAPRGFMSLQRIDPNHTSFIDYDRSNFILPTGWRISRRLYGGMIVYTSPDNHTQTYFPPGTYHKVSGNNIYANRPYLTACAATALAKLSAVAFGTLDQEAKFRAAELFCCIKLAIQIRDSTTIVLGGGGNNAQLKMQVPRLDRLYSKKSYKNNRKTKNKNRNKSKSMSMFKSAKRTFYRTNKRNKTSRHYH